MSLYYRVGFYETPANRHLVIVFSQVFQNKSSDNPGYYVYHDYNAHSTYTPIGFGKPFSKCKKISKQPVEGPQGIIDYLQKHALKRQWDQITRFRQTCFPTLAAADERYQITIVEGGVAARGRRVLGMSTNMLEAQKRMRLHCEANNAPEMTTFWVENLDSGVRKKFMWDAERKYLAI